MQSEREDVIQKQATTKPSHVAINKVADLIAYFLEKEFTNEVIDNSLTFTFENNSEEVDDTFTNEDAKIVVQALANVMCPKQIFIEILVHKIEEEALQTLATILDINTELKDFTLRFYKTREMIGKNPGESLLTWIEKLKKGTSLDRFALIIHKTFSNINWASVMSAFANAFTSPNELPSWFELLITGCAVGDENISKVMQAIGSGHCPHRFVLSFGGSNYGSLSIKALADSLEKNCPAELEIWFSDDRWPWCDCEETIIELKDMILLTNALKKRNPDNKLSLFFTANEDAHPWLSQFPENENTECINLLTEAVRTSFSLLIHSHHKHPLLTQYTLRNIAIQKLISEHPEFKSLILKFYQDKYEGDSNRPRFRNVPFSLTQLSLFKVLTKPEAFKSSICTEYSKKIKKLSKFSDGIYNNNYRGVEGLPNIYNLSTYKIRAKIAEYELSDIPDKNINDGDLQATYKLADEVNYQLNEFIKNRNTLLIHHYQLLFGETYIPQELIDKLIDLSILLIELKLTPEQLPPHGVLEIIADEDQEEIRASKRLEM